MTSAIRSVVNTGEVDSMTNKSPSLRKGITERVADSTYVISARWFCLKGVGTTTKKASACSGFVVARRAPLQTASFTTLAKSGSTICIRP